MSEVKKKDGGGHNLGSEQKNSDDQNQTVDGNEMKKADQVVDDP